MDNCALDRDNSVVKATAINSGLHNQTTAQSFLIIIAWRIGRDNRDRQISKWLASLKIETTAQSRLQQNSPDFTTRSRNRSYLNLLPGESDETKEKGIFLNRLLRYRSRQQRSQGYSKIHRTSQRDHSSEHFRN